MKAIKTLEEKRKTKAAASQRFRDLRKASGLKEIKNIYASEEDEIKIRAYAASLKN